MVAQFRRWVFSEEKKGATIAEKTESAIDWVEVAYLLYFPLHHCCCSNNKAELTALTNWPVKPKSEL